MKIAGARAMLNGPGFQSTAAIVAEIEVQAPKHYSIDPDTGEFLTWTPVPHYTLQLSDCDRSISFDLDFGDEEDACKANNLAKIDTIIETLRAFRRGLSAEQDKYYNAKRALERRQKKGA